MRGITEIRQQFIAGSLRALGGQSTPWMFPGRSFRSADLQGTVCGRVWQLPISIQSGTGGQRPCWDWRCLLVSRLDRKFRQFLSSGRRQNRQYPDRRNKRQPAQSPDQQMPAKEMVERNESEFRALPDHQIGAIRFFSDQVRPDRYYRYIDQAEPFGGDAPAAITRFGPAIQCGSASKEHEHSFWISLS